MIRNSAAVQPQHPRLARLLSITGIILLCLGEIFNPSTLTEVILFLRVIHYGLIVLLVAFALRTAKITTQSEFDVWAGLIIGMSNVWLLGACWDTDFAIEPTLALFLAIYISFYFISSIKFVSYYSSLLAVSLTIAVLNTEEISMSPALLLAMLYFYLLTGFISMRKILNDRRQLEESEESLRSSRDRAEDAVRARNDFMTNMSHELRTPLNGIIGMTGLLEKSRLQIQQKEMVDTINMSGQLLLSLINDILDYAKLEASGTTLTVKDNDIEYCSAQCVDLVLPLALRKGISLYLDVEPATLKNLAFDSIKVSQVLVNLLNNALKFTDVGEVRLEIRTETLIGEVPLLICRVIDTGVGIPEAQKKLIFEEFSQGDLSVTRRFGGTGLGLTICRRLLDAMGGTIGVESTVGVGSVFEVRIPVEIPAIGADEKLALEQEKNSLRGQNALLLASDETLSRILRKNMQYWGVETQVETSIELLPNTLGSIKNKDKLPNFIICEFEPSSPELSKIKHQLAAIYTDKPYSLIVLCLRNQSDCHIDPDLLLVNPLKTSALKLAMENSISESRVGQRGEIEDTKLTQISEPPLKILVAEDNQINQKVAFAILNKLGYRADLASNGVEALAKASSDQYDVILMDVQMPEMDGLTSTIKIRELNGPQPVIIAMTANAFDQDRQKCLAAGMDSFIAKPIDFEKLESSLKSIGQTDSA